MLVSHHIHQRELPFASCELAFAVAELTGGKADFLQSIWNGSDFFFTHMYGNQLYMDAWRMLQGLEDMNGTEKLTNQSMSQKLKKEAYYRTWGYREN